MYRLGKHFTFIESTMSQNKSKNLNLLYPLSNIFLYTISFNLFWFYFKNKIHCLNLNLK